MDKTYISVSTEDALTAILNVYDGNEDLSVSGTVDIFPSYMKRSVSEELFKLKNAGLILSY